MRVIHLITLKGREEGGKKETTDCVLETKSKSRATHKQMQERKERVPKIEVRTLRRVPKAVVGPGQGFFRVF